MAKLLKQNNKIDTKYEPQGLAKIKISTNLQGKIDGPFWFPNIKTWKISRWGQLYATAFGKIFINSNIHCLSFTIVVIIFNLRIKTEEEIRLHSFLCQETPKILIPFFLFLVNINIIDTWLIKKQALTVAECTVSHSTQKF